MGANQADVAQAIAAMRLAVRLELDALERRQRGHADDVRAQVMALQAPPAGGPDAWLVQLQAGAWPSHWPGPHVMLRHLTGGSWIRATRQGDAPSPGGLVQLSSPAPFTVDTSLRMRHDEVKTARVLLRRLDALEAGPSPAMLRDILSPGSAASAPLTFVYGPAGTGKTAVLASRAEAATQQGLRVLLSAPAHPALRVLVEALGPGTIKSQLVVATLDEVLTLAGQGLPVIDLAVIDDVASANLPTVVSVACLARQVIVAGDPAQLPPAAHAQPPGLNAAQQVLYRDWYTRDLLSLSGMLDKLGHPVSSPHLIQCRTQHRMPPAIAALVHAVAYPQLEAPGLPEPQAEPQDGLEAPVLVIDSAPMRIAGTRQGGNAVHAAVVAELIQRWSDQGRLVGPREQRPAVMTPYRNQTQAIDRMLGERFGSDGTGLAGPVYDLQGEVRPLVILDTVANGATTLGPFFTAMTPGSVTARQLNVALSRASEQLVIVADVDRIATMTQPGSPLQTLVRHIAVHGTVLDVSAVIGLRSPLQMPLLSQNLLGRPSFFTDTDVYLGVTWDLHRAQRRVDIFTPELQGPSARPWLELLANTARRGVNIIVWTRPCAVGTTAWQVCRYLDRVGCQVRYRTDLRERHILIDDVLWQGRLNLMGMLNPPRVMLRMRSRSATAQARLTMERSSYSTAAR